MPDIVDMAADLEAEHLARSLGRVARTIPAGAAGICDVCDEPRARLVNGRCGYCRDGRVPPPSSFIDPPETEECLPVPAYLDGKYISVPADAATLKTIQERAGRDGIALGQAALNFIREALATNREGVVAQATAEPSAAAEWDGTREGAVVFLENVPDRWLTEELIRRFKTCVGSDDHAAVVQEHAAAVERAEAAEARAIAAEGALASLKTSLKGLVS